MNLFGKHSTEPQPGWSPRPRRRGACSRRVATGLVVISALLFCLLAPTGSGAATNSFLQMRNGYFWDPAAEEYFVPRGVAYQIWNPPVGANQSLAQVDYDLLEFKKMRANSVRAELTWGQFQVAPNQYDWTRADHLVSQAEQLGLKLFVIIGYQYPPA